jgi:iron(II)-dependent oxidoreductase
MSEDKKNDDWGMTMPHQRLDDEARKIADAPAEPSNAPVAEWEMDSVPSLPGDFDKTTPNLRIDPLPAAAHEDWAADDARITTEEKKGDWKMPDPVFRISAGETPVFDRHEDWGHPPVEATPNADPGAAAAPQTNAQTAVRPAPKKSGTGKLILILAGLLGFLVVAAAALVGGYFLVFDRTSAPSVTSANRAPSTPAADRKEPVSSSRPESTPATLPPSIELKGEMVLVAAGEFTFGSETGGDESKPAHTVGVDAFYIDKYEVTNAQYKAFCDATGRAYPASQYWDKDYFDTRPNAPVLGVSFDDARAYAEWAGKRLPTESEWEKAASWDPVKRSKREFPWGDQNDTSKAAFNIASPSDVGKFPAGASPSGAHDMAGNAVEWVDAWFQPYPGNSSSNPNFGQTNRVVRGGYFGSKTLESLKATKRIYVLPGFVPTEEQASYIGFRCAVAANDPRIAPLLK